MAMGYWTYYLACIALAAALQYPWLAGLAIVFFVFRRFIPDPFVWLRTMGRIRALRTQIDANPANVTARRDLEAGTIRHFDRTLMPAGRRYHLCFKKSRAQDPEVRNLVQWLRAERAPKPVESIAQKSGN